MRGRRWDIDERKRGVASGLAFSPNVEQIASAMAQSDWVAEEAEAHLLPHIRASCQKPGSSMRLVMAHVEDAVLVVDLAWLGDDAPQPDTIRLEMFRVIGSFAEHTTHVRQRSMEGAVAFEVATGTTDESPFAPHGHLVRLRVDPSA